LPMSPRAATARAGGAKPLRPSRLVDKKPRSPTSTALQWSAQKRLNHILLHVGRGHRNERAEAVSGHRPRSL
jgi:hypothetical protein